MKLQDDLPKRNGTDTFELPLPGRFAADREGVIRQAFINADYKLRMEPIEIFWGVRGVALKNILDNSPGFGYALPVHQRWRQQ